MPYNSSTQSPPRALYVTQRIARARCGLEGPTQMNHFCTQITVFALFPYTADKSALYSSALSILLPYTLPIPSAWTY